MRGFLCLKTTYGVDRKAEQIEKSKALNESSGSLGVNGECYFYFPVDQHLPSDRTNPDAALPLALRGQQHRLVYGEVMRLESRIERKAS